MINRDKLRDMILKNESWGNIESHEDFQVTLITEKTRRINVWKWLITGKPRLAAVAGLLTALVVSVILFQPRGEKIMISYPFNGETSVDLIGSFNRWDKKIAMRLDKDAGLWKAEVRVSRKGIYEYQFIIDELIYSAGNSKYKVKGSAGDEKAVMIVSYTAGSDRNGAAD